MPYVAFNSIPTSNETGCLLYVFGCGPAGDLAPGATTVLTGNSPGVGRFAPLPPEEYYWVGPGDLELNPPAFAQFTQCTDTTVVLTVFHPGDVRETLELSRASRPDPDLAEERDTAAGRLAEG